MLKYKEFQDDEFEIVDVNKTRIYAKISKLLQSW